MNVEDARAIVLDCIEPVGVEKIPIRSSLGMVLAEDIRSDVNISPFDNSAMDGYAVKAADIQDASPDNQVILRVIDDVRAGYVTGKTLQPGEAIRIMTGAPVPEGADSVVMKEYTETQDDRIVIKKAVKPGENIRRSGEDVKIGDLVLKRGYVIGSAAMGLLASLGRYEVNVGRKPRVAILATGDELVDVGEDLAPGKIRSSNSYTLFAQVLESGGIPIDLGISKDDPLDVKTKIQTGLDYDMILTSGGVSVGDYDFVKEVMTELGLELKFWKVAMKPGKPVAFGLIQGKPVFGLPGNPVSSMVTFELLARPAILKMGGHKKLRRPEVVAVLENDVKKRPGRRHYVRARVSRENGSYIVTTTGPQSSGILRSMTLANGLVIIPEESDGKKAGEEVTVHLLDRPESE